MVISAVARAMSKAAATKRALKPVKTRALKPRDRRVKKVSKTIKSVRQGMDSNRRALRKEQQKKEHLRIAQPKHQDWLAMRGYLWKFYDWGGKR